MTATYGIFVYFFLVSAVQIDGQIQVAQSGYRPSSGLVVVIDPDHLIGDGLRQAWSCVHEPFLCRCITSQSFSKVNFSISPVLSLNGAVTNVHLKGSSAGESSSKSGSREVITDALTRFEASQQMFLNSDGIGFSRADLEVKTDQTVNQIKSKKPFGQGMIRAAYKKNPERIKSESNAFARLQIERRLAESQIRLQNQAAATAGNLLMTYPVLGRLGWHFSSNNRAVFITAISDDPISSALPKLAAPAAIVVHEKFVKLLCRQELADRTIGSSKLNENYVRLSKRFQFPPLEGGEQQLWSMVLGSDPVSIRFAEKRIFTDVSIRLIESGDKTLSDITVSFVYDLLTRDGQWMLVRAGDVDVQKSALLDEKLGARQQVFKTVMQKRFEQIVPSRISLPRLSNRSPRSESALDLAIRDISTTDGNLVISIDHR